MARTIELAGLGADQTGWLVGGIPGIPGSGPLGGSVAVSVILLDTNVSTSPPAERPGGEVLVSSIISLAELYFGIRSSVSEEIRRQRMRRLAVSRELMDWILFDESAAESYGELAAKVRLLRPQHARSKDIMIAARAHSLGIPPMTRNAKNFELVSDVIEILEVG